MRRRLLLVEDDAALGEGLRSLLAAEDFDVHHVRTAEAAATALDEGSYEVLLTDVRLPGRDGLQLMDLARASKPGLPVIVMTAHGTAETAMEATSRGAHDYLVKPFEPAELLDLLEGAVERSRLMQEPVSLAEAGPVGPALLGRSRAIQSVCKEIGRVAATPMPVLILGETGTGKELVARALYQHGTRREGPLIAVNCAAVPETLLESELFGHERGAFTGADRRRIGRFEQASEGTLLLDEIGELSAATQAKLLRVLQDGVFHRLGGSEAIHSTARLVAATHRDLEREVAEGGGFRADLYFRLSVITLRLPPLRDRREDIGMLATHFVRLHAGECGAPRLPIHAEAMRLLEEQSWPGNVRQLENVVRRALILARPCAVGPEHVRRALSPGGVEPDLGAGSLSGLVAEVLAKARREGTGNAHAQVLSAVEGEVFRQAVRLANGNQAQAARWLGVSRLRVRQAMSDLGLR
ncbi:MAG: sigma-54-dependent Fis family transcriptional regulator [Verrucomicrobiales bacterium]|nr:sigma-54-dependent Fis family transcriptional regulator [Verrucomicrobiales bacterium]